MTLEALKQIAKYIRRHKADISNYDVKKQTIFIQKLKMPANDIERSYFQYKCQMKLLGGLTSLAYRLGSLPLLLYYRKCLRKRSTINKSLHSDMLFLYGGDDSILPNSIKKDRDILHIEGFQKNMSLTQDDMLFLRELDKRHPTAWYFRLKCLLKVAIYSYHIRNYNPKAIIVSEEYSFTSSMLTAYCEKNNVEHINVMHGEKLYDITDAFFHFDKCYIWDEHYRALFCDLRAEPTQFIIEKPESLLPWNFGSQQKTVDYTYYLGGENRRKMKQIRDNLSIIQKAGYSITIRPHPRYSSLDDVRTIFSDFIVENQQQVSIRESIARTKNAVSLCSTVLGQAQANGVNIIIDDISAKRDYAQLIQLRYYYVSCIHDRLSSHIEQCSYSLSQEGTI